MSFSFGAATQQPSTGFGAFGQQPATSTAPTAGFGGFGQQPATSAAPTSTGFGGFGQQPATSTAPSTGFGGGFGAPATSTAPSTGFGGFGQQQPATSTAGTGFGGFGQTSTAPASTSTGFSFGTPATSTAVTSAAPSAGFSFGNTSAAPATSTPSLFGGATSSTITGFGGGFGAKPTSSFGLNTTSGGLFGAKPTTSTFGGGGGLFVQQTQQTNTQQRDQQIYNLLAQVDEEARRAQAPSITSQDYTPENVWHALALMKSWWDPKSPNCRFKYYFYNVVSPQEVALYQKPADHDKAAWDKAQAANPDRTTMVPALAIGFDDVQKRMEQQEKLSQAHADKLLQIQEILKKIQHKDIVETANKLTEYKRRHMEAAQRVIKLLKYAQVLRNKGLSITPEEEDMRARFENIQDQLQRSEQFHGKLSQLWAQLQLIKESGRQFGKNDDRHAWESVSEVDMNGITKILEEQDNGIQHIIQVIDKDSQEIDLVHQGWKGSQQYHQNHHY